MGNFDFARGPGQAAAPGEENGAARVSHGMAPMDFTRLPGEEIERLISLCCQAPVALWRLDTVSERPAEPFGMIA